jgi:hypothetical protein
MQAASIGLILSSVLLLWFWRSGLFSNHSTNHTTNHPANLYLRFTLLVWAVSAGALWHSVSAARQLESQLPAGADGEVFQLHGYVSGLVRQTGRGWQFEFETLSAERLENVEKDQSANRQAEPFSLVRLESSSESGSALDFHFSGKTLLTYYPEDFFYGAVNNDSSSGLRNRQEPDEPRAALEIPSQLRPGTMLDLSARLSSHGEWPTLQSMIARPRCFAMVFLPPALSGRVSNSAMNTARLTLPPTVDLWCGFSSSDSI